MLSLLKHVPPSLVGVNPSSSSTFPISCSLVPPILNIEGTTKIIRDKGSQIGIRLLSLQKIALHIYIGGDFHVLGSNIKSFLTVVCVKFCHHFIYLDFQKLFNPLSSSLSLALTRGNYINTIRERNALIG